MGSITSRPSIPKSPKIVYVPSTVTTAVTTNETASATDTGQDGAAVTQTDEELTGELRRENLLRRNRGRFGTVLSGFRGLFTKQTADGARKTLLGE